MGNPGTDPGTVIIRPVVTEQTGLHVEFSLSCVGCLQLTGTVTPPIDKSNPVLHYTPQSVFNFNPQTGSAVQSFPLYTAPSINLACADCFVSVQQSALYLAVTYSDSAGFQTIQIEADVSILANLDLALTVNGSQSVTYTKVLKQLGNVFYAPLLVASIQLSATIDDRVVDH